MKIQVNRIAKKESYTIGKMYVDGTYVCDTLEDACRELNSAEDKIAGQTAIPAGTYNVCYCYSPRFKKNLPLLENVPYFTGIRIHSGNTAADTEGCILVGENTQVGKVLNSRANYNKLEELIKRAISYDEAITITIE